MSSAPARAVLPASNQALTKIGEFEGRLELIEKKLPEIEETNKLAADVKDLLKRADEQEKYIDFLKEENDGLRAEIKALKTVDDHTTTDDSESEEKVPTKTEGDIEQSALAYADDTFKDESHEVELFGETYVSSKFSLPKLEKLVGPNSMFRYLDGPFPLLRYARITWDTTSSNDTVLPLLSESSSPALRHLDNVVSIRSLPSLTAIAEHVPHISNLTFRIIPKKNEVYVTGKVLDRFHKSLEEAIESFTNILTLTIIPIDEKNWLEYDLDLEDVDDEFDFVTHLGGLCPNLRTIAMYRGIVWERDIPSSNCWLPTVYSEKSEWVDSTEKYEDEDVVWVNSYVPDLPRQVLLQTYVWNRWK
ncbi:hypothetical protein C0995_012452 [Termitomyces sp. Mi166|nr:hypothetical protein C0995_012452 [Termitomyces sp. Mi166\